MAIGTSLFSRHLARIWGEKRVYLVGLAADLASMALLLATRFVMRDHAVALGGLLAATTFLGIGFGLTVPATNNFAAAFFPGRVDTAVLALNALLGLGTALAPVFVAVFVGLGIWWGMPLVVGVLVAVLAATSLGLPLRAEVAARRGAHATFRAFAAFALLLRSRGDAEWKLGHPLSLEHARQRGRARIAGADDVLGRGDRRARPLRPIERWFPARHTFRLLPWLEAAGFVGIALLPSAPGALGPLAFALTGFGCSALLPLMISLGRRALSAGQVITFYQVGYGVAAFGVGPLAGHTGLRPIFAAGTAVALALAVLAVALVHRPSGATSSPTASRALPWPR
jgi:MFS family permease